MNPVSRRTFLVASAGVLLAACGSKARGSSAGSNGTVDLGDGSSATIPPGQLVVVRFWEDGILTTGAQRMPIGLGDSNGLVTTGGPDPLTAKVLDDHGKTVATVSAPRHAQDLPRPYWPFQTTLTTPGIYTLAIDLNGKSEPAAFSVKDPKDVAVPRAGDKLIPLDTPTTTDKRGVDPICTRQPVCPLHGVTLTQAMGSGKPVAFLIATPAYCQTAACGPVLDVLLKQHDRLGDQVAMVHAEVYKNDQPSADTVTAAVTTYKLDYEPVLFLAGPDGVIKERIDSLFDTVEVSAALDRLVA
jgi:hypothetical protein